MKGANRNRRDTANWPSARANPSTGVSGMRVPATLFDVVDGDPSNNQPTDDPACRPNQLFAISLRSSGAR